jgi:hypothetical protein
VACFSISGFSFVFLPLRPFFRQFGTDSPLLIFPVERQRLVLPPVSYSDFWLLASQLSVAMFLRGSRTDLRFLH